MFWWCFLILMGIGMYFFNLIKNFSEEKVRSYGAQYDAFWIFMLLFYLMPPFTWSYWAPGPYPNSWILVLRIISFLLGGAIALRRFWPSSCKPYLPLFWHFTLFFWCPFRTVFILLYSAHSKGFSIYGFVGIFLLAVLTDEISYSIILLLGLVITPIFFYATGGLTADFPTTQYIIQAFWMISTISIFKWVFFRQQRNQALEKIKWHQNIAKIVAHEIRVPLSSIFIASKALKNKINEENINEIKQIQSHIEKLASQAQITIDMIFFRLGTKNNQAELVKCSLNDCLKEALSQYPFENGEKEKIELNIKDDIFFWGDRRLVIHVIFNLIKNALYAIRNTGKGNMLISIDSSTSQLRFKDTALGLCPNKSKEIFKEFYTTKANGAGMGLFFCKQALLQMGGSISCSSKKDSFTEFLITFPKLNEGI